MKKFLLILLVLMAPAVASFAETADYFTFTFGAGGGYDLVADDVVANIVYGVDYQFDSQFSGGFKFYDINAVSVAVMNITMSPKDNLYVSLYTGSEPVLGKMVFGAGIGYDFFTKNEGLFSSMGVFLDWFAGDSTGTYNIKDGGTFLIGMKSKFGI